MTELYYPYNELDEVTVNIMSEAMTDVGINTHHPHYNLTPHRYVHYLQHLMGGKEFHLTVFDNIDPVIDAMIVVQDIPFWSACSHHTLPFFGKVSVAYIPNQCLVGLSKIPLLVRNMARGFWLQEHLAEAIADKMVEALSPLGVGIYIEAQHTCQLLDLLQPPIPLMKLSVLRGCFHPLDPTYHGDAREEFLAIIEK